MKCCYLLAVLGTLALCVIGAPIEDPDYTTQIAQADAYMNALQSERVIGGIAAGMPRKCPFWHCTALLAMLTAVQGGMTYCKR